FGLLSGCLLLGRLLSRRQRPRFRYGHGSLHGRAVLAENRECTTREDQPVFELNGTGRNRRGCARRRSCSAARLPFLDAADPAHALHAFGLHRAGLYAVGALTGALKEATLVADDRGSRLQAAVVIDFLGIGLGEGGKIAAVGWKPGRDLGRNESGRAFLER